MITRRDDPPRHPPVAGRDRGAAGSATAPLAGRNGRGSSLPGSSSPGRALRVGFDNRHHVRRIEQVLGEIAPRRRDDAVCRDPSHPAISASSSASCSATAGRSIRLSRSSSIQVAWARKHARRTVGLEVDTPDELAVEQERQHVVAVDPLRLRGVDLDAVVEAEQALGAFAEPHQRVERAEQGPARRPGAASTPPGGATPACPSRRPRRGPAGRRRRARRRPACDVAALESVVVAEIGDGGDAERAGSQQQQLPPGLVFRRPAGGEHVGGDDALDQVVAGGRSRSGGGSRRRARGRTGSPAPALASSQSHHVPGCGRGPRRRRRRSGRGRGPGRARRRASRGVAA